MTEFVEMLCGECGIAFAVPTGWQTARKNDGRGFWCPNGHQRVFRETIPDRLRRELAIVEQRNARLAEEAAAANRRAEAAEKAAKRLRARVDHGVCPDCNRSFTNLTRHMAGQHGALKPKLVAEVVKLPARKPRAAKAKG